MADLTTSHATIDHTGLTGVGGSVASDVIWDTKGDLAVATAANTASKLAAGSNGKLLMADSTQTTGLIWTARHRGCKVYNDATQSISNNSATAITFGAEEYDTDAFHDTGSNTSRITIPSGLDGTYLFEYGASLAANATGVRIAFLRKNGVDDTHNVIGSRQNLTPISASLSSDGGRAVTVALVATDYIELFIYQTSGGALNAGSSLAVDRGDVNWLSCTFLG